MKKQIALYICTIILCLFPLKGEETASSANTFNLGKGINICHWLAEHFDFIPSKEVYFTQADVRFLKQTGFDHIRIPIEEIEMWNEDGTQNEEAFSYLDKALQWAKEADMKVVLDMHIIKGHHFNVNTKENFPANTLFTSEKTLHHLIDVWSQISDRYHVWPNDFLAYEILNEPIADDPEQWNHVVEEWMKAMREKEPNRFIVIGSNMWQKAKYFPNLKIPDDDKHIILSFHFYHPYSITHYKACWIGPYSKYDGPINYPGNLVSQSYLKKLPEGHIKKQLTSELYNDKESLRSLMMPAIDYANKYGLELYCGEWGTIDSLPRTPRLNWYRDMSQIFSEENIHYAVWSYKSVFGIRSDDGAKIDNELIEAILNGK